MGTITNELHNFSCVSTRVFNNVLQILGVFAHQLHLTSILPTHLYWTNGLTFPFYNTTESSLIFFVFFLLLFTILYFNSVQFCSFQIDSVHLNMTYEYKYRKRFLQDSTHLYDFCVNFPGVLCVSTSFLSSWLSPMTVPQSIFCFRYFHFYFYFYVVLI